jgi:flagellar hook-associated protein 1 FlgK
MGLTQALATSASGLRVVQAGMSLVSSNVANAQTPGYVRKTLVTQSTAAGQGTIGVQAIGVQRELSQYVQAQYRTENAGGAYADTTAQFLDRVQQLFGQPGGDGSLEATYNNFTTALQTLQTSPESFSAQSGAVSAGQALAQQLNGIGDNVQELRGEAESGIADAVQQANDAMQHIASINRQLAASTSEDTSTAALEDQRDQYVDQLSQLMDIRAVPTGTNQVTVFTNSGVQLVGAQAAQLSFQAQGTMTANTQWSADPSKDQVGTVTLVSANGDSIDLLANKSIRSGQIAALVQLRDQTLVQAQSQIDAIANGLAQAASDQTTAGTAVAVGAQNGFNLDLTGLQACNTVNLTYTDVATGQQHAVTFVRVDDPGALPLSNSVTADPNDRVVGISFAGGMASVATQAAAALGPGFAASNPSGATLQVLDDGGATVTLDNASTTITATSLTSGNVQLPLFTDGGTPYTGAITSTGSQSVGFANRISINAALLSDPSKMVTYSTSPPTPVGDSTRAAFLLQQLTATSLTFAGNTGIGSIAAPFQSTLPAFVQQVIGQQAQASANATGLQQGQQVVVSALAQRMGDTSAVNMDQEMTNLLQLQSAYAANARVMTTIRDMLQMLEQM